MNSLTLPMGNRRRKSLMLSLTILNILGIAFYFSPVTLYGYWSDAIFLLTISLLTFIFLRQLQVEFIKTTLLIICIFNFLILSYNTLSIFHGIVPVHLIPHGHYQDKNTYAYFVGRGNSGLTSGCYGEIQYHKKISWFPILEVKYETEYCSQMDYNSIVNGA